MKIVLGILMCSIGLFFLVLYLNVLSMGYSFFEYVHFISRKMECWLVVWGVLLLALNHYERRHKDAILS